MLPRDLMAVARLTAWQGWASCEGKRDCEAYLGDSWTVTHSAKVIKDKVQFPISRIDDLSWVKKTSLALRWKGWEKRLRGYSVPWIHHVLGIGSLLIVAVWHRTSCLTSLNSFSSLYNKDTYTRLLWDETINMRRSQPGAWHMINTY